jgi:hypothetical protein
VIVKECTWLIVSWLAIQVCLGHNLSALVSDTHTLTFTDTRYGVIMWISGNRRYCDCNIYVSLIATSADGVPDVRINCYITFMHQMSPIV